MSGGNPLGLTLPPRAALLLDCDGTLLDLAATPGAVVVPAGLIDALRQVRDQLGGALAIVTGRPVAQIEALLADAPYAIAGEHGAALRRSPTAPIEEIALPTPPQAWLDQAAAAIAQFPGALLEPKRRGFVLHYRLNPSGALVLERMARELVASDPRFALLPASMAWEVKAIGVDKGTAVHALMATPPFAGRTPVFIGDDVTDEDGVAAAVALGGIGLRVPAAFGDAAGVRAWIARLAGNQGNPPLL